MTDDGVPSHHIQPDEQSEVFGPIDAGALREIRDLFVDLEPLVQTASLDDPLNPHTLSVKLSDGVGVASTARIVCSVLFRLSGVSLVWRCPTRDYLAWCLFWNNVRYDDILLAAVLAVDNVWAKLRDCRDEELFSSAEY